MSQAAPATRHGTDAARVQRAPRSATPETPPAGHEQLAVCYTQIIVIQVHTNPNVCPPAQVHHNQAPNRPVKLSWSVAVERLDLTSPQLPVQSPVNNEAYTVRKLGTCTTSPCVAWS